MSNSKLGVIGERQLADGLSSGPPVKSYPTNDSALSISVWRRPITWLVLIPLLYLTMAGNLIPETGNATLQLASGDESGESHREPLILVMLICTALIFTRRSTILAACQTMKLVFALPILAVLSVLWSEIPGHTLISAGIILVFTCFAVYLSIEYNPHRQLELIVLTGALTITLSLICIGLSPSTFASPEGWIGIYARKQNCSALATFFLIAMLHWKPPNSLYRILRGFFVGLCLIFVVMSQSRTGWGICLFALVLSACLWSGQKMRPKEILAGIILGVPLLLGIFYAISVYSTEILSAVGKDPTISQRTIIWAAVLDSIAQHPILGYGFAAFWRGMEGPSVNIILVADWKLWQAQNGYLDIALQLGLVGILCLALLVGQTVRNIMRCFKKSSNSAYVRWCIVMFICELLYDVGETSLVFQRMTWFIFLLACIGLSKAARERWVQVPGGIQADSLNQGICS